MEFPPPAGDERGAGNPGDALFDDWLHSYTNELMSYHQTASSSHTRPDIHMDRDMGAPSAPMAMGMAAEGLPSSQSGSAEPAAG